MHVKPEHVENLKVGEYIAILSCYEKREEATDDAMAMFGFSRRQQRTGFDGRPLEILAIHIPWIAVHDGINTFTIDLRVWGVRKVSTRYAQAIRGSIREPIRVSGEIGVSRVGRRRRKKEKPDKSLCPRCQSKMIQRQVITPDPNKKGWFVICPTCGFDNGKVATE